MGRVVVAGLVAITLVAGCAVSVLEPPSATDSGGGTSSGRAVRSGTNDAEMANAQPAGPPGTFTVVDCPPARTRYAVEITCGWLTVPARRDLADDATLDLAVRVLHAQEPVHADPVVYLSGGPGGDSLTDLSAWTTEPLLASRDVVLLDQRGTGASEPDVSCPEEQRMADLFEAERRCRDRLDQEGVDLRVLRTTETAADVADLRTALGYESWNLWGASYGTRVALAVLRDHPDGVRSAVLEGVYPHQVDAYAELVRSDQEAIDHLAAMCAADASCTELAGDVRELLEELIVELEDVPRDLTARHLLDGSELLDGYALLRTVTAGLGDSARIGAVPGWLAHLADGGDRPFLLYARHRGYQIADPGVSTATFYVIECAEEVAHSTLAERSPEEAWDALAIAEDDVIGNLAALDVFWTLESCQIWDTGGSPALEDEAVTSDVPTLLVTGLFDPQTRPTWTWKAADGLSEATVLELPHRGHDTIDIDPCARSVFEAFLDDPGSELPACPMNVLPDFGR